MSVASIAVRYAKSIIDMASEKKALPEVMDDMQMFNEAIGNRDFLLLIKSPIVKADKKQKVFAALFDGKMNKLTTSFFDIVIRKGREQYLPDIVREAIRQYKKLQNITTASLTTAVPISDETKAALRKELEANDDIDGTIEMETFVDPDVIGGFVLEIEGFMYDASVREKINALRQNILDNSYIKSL